MSGWGPVFERTATYAFRRYSETGWDIELETQQSLPMKSYSARYNYVGICVRAAAVLVLLFAVAALSTLAKDGLYFSRTSIARHTSDSTKMVPSHASVVFCCEKQGVAQSQPQPPIRNTLPVPASTAPARQIGVVVSMQHRSPPAFPTL